MANERTKERNNEGALKTPPNRDEMRRIAEEFLDALGIPKSDNLDDEERNVMRRAAEDWRRRKAAKENAKGAT